MSVQAPCMNKFKVLGQDKSLYGFIDQMAVGLIHYHNHEVRFYQLIAPNYPHLHFPRLYGFEESDASTKRHGRLLLEGLSDRAGMADVVHGLSIDQCCAVVEQLAKFHVFSRFMNNSAALLTQFQDNHRLELHDEELQIWKRCLQLDETYFLRHERAYRNLLASAAQQPVDAHKRFGEQR